MRPVVLALLVLSALGAIWVGARARADEGEAPTPELLLRRIEALELDVQYLASRDRALTNYLLGHQARARALAQSLRTARDEGFTAGAISSTSREALLDGLETLAEELPKDLPEVTKEEKELLERALRLR